MIAASDLKAGMTFEQDGSACLRPFTVPLARRRAAPVWVWPLCRKLPAPMAPGGA